MLVEFPQLTIPVGAGELFQRLLAQDTRPILVHPERNAQIQMNPSIVAKFVQSGILVQVTAMSVTGEFGPAAKSCADTLLRHDCVHFLATDAHRAKSRPPILSKGRAAAARVIGEERAIALVEANPLAVIKGEPVNVRPPISFESSAQPKRSFFSRFFS
jgi:protein-tyrosine phosphatase